MPLVRRNRLEGIDDLARSQKPYKEPKGTFDFSSLKVPKSCWTEKECVAQSKERLLIGFDFFGMLSRQEDSSGQLGHLLCRN